MVLLFLYTFSVVYECHISETGSKKLESHRLAIMTLLELSISNLGKKGSKLMNQVPAVEFVESFVNARTLFNANASHFGNMIQSSSSLTKGIYVVSSRLTTIWNAT
jgi:hypothetical protein